MKKGLNAIFISMFMAVVASFAAYKEMWFLSHMCFLVLGMVFAAVMKDDEKRIEAWARKKLNGVL